jgi:four helix bundle protein
MQNQNSKVKSEIRHRAYEYCIRVIKFIDGLNNDVSTSVISKQLLRSATSIGANLVEAKSASSKKDFTNFFSHSLKSANETLFWLGLLRDAKNIKNKEINYLLSETKELANIIASSIITLKGKR